MRPVPPYRLWLGHRGDVQQLSSVLSAGVEAFVDLAIDEPPVGLPRSLISCRFPLLDGAGNPAWLLRLAVETTASLVRSGTPTLVFCGAGMSRSPAVLAMALAVLTGQSGAECLLELKDGGPCDVAAGLWQDLQSAFIR